MDSEEQRQVEEEIRFRLFGYRRHKEGSIERTFFEADDQIVEEKPTEIERLIRERLYGPEAIEASQREATNPETGQTFEQIQEKLEQGFTAEEVDELSVAIRTRFYGPSQKERDREEVSSEIITTTCPKRRAIMEGALRGPVDAEILNRSCDWCLYRNGQCDFQVLKGISRSHET